MKSRHQRKYLKDIAITAAVALGLLGAFNLMIDVDGVFGINHSPRMEQAKVWRGGRIAKAEQALSTRWDTLLLGNSRVESGLDPAHPAWGNARVYNCGLSGLGFIEQARIFSAIEEHTPPRVVVLGIDFLHFQNGATVSDEFAHSRFNQDRARASQYLEALWGITATWHSYQTVGAYRDHRAADYSALGLRIKPMAPEGRSGHDAYRRYLAHAADAWRNQMSVPGDSRCCEALSRVLQLAAQRNTHLIIVIMPVHGLDLEMCRVQSNSEGAVEQWKRRLVRILAEFRQAHPEAPATELWDFTGYRGRVAEPIPPPNDPRPMRWYWEPSHFRREMGDLLISRINQSAEPSDFGVQINDANIEGHLSQLRADRAPFLLDFAPQIRAIEKTAPGLRR